MPANDCLVGLVGSGIAPSLSPALHRREADELGLHYQYRRFDLDTLGLPATAIGELLRAARLTGYDGLNVTHPCKQLVLDQLDALSPDAAAIGAVNTVVFEDERTIGYNTDWSGFALSLDHGLPQAQLDHVVLLGAGGAGAAVGHALLTLGATRLDVVDSDADRARRLTGTLCTQFGPGRAQPATNRALGGLLTEADGLVHATPTGMAEHPGTAVPTHLLHPSLWVADVVYRPLRTALVAAARERRCRVLDGGSMAVFQAAGALRLFTAREPDTGRMLRHFASIAEPTEEVRDA